MTPPEKVDGHDACHKGITTTYHIPHTTHHTPTMKKQYLILGEHDTDFTVAGTAFRLPLDSNTVPKLQALIRILDPTLHTSQLRKNDLVSAAMRHISFKPLAETLEAVPALKALYLETPTSHNQAYFHMGSASGLIATELKQPSVHHDTVVHCEFLRSVFQKRYDDLYSKFMREQQELAAPPAWWDLCVHVQPTTGSFWEISVRIGSETHDGYCSDPSESYVPDDCWETQTRYLPNTAEKTWTGKELRKKTTWKGPGDCGTGGSGYCESAEHTEILSMSLIQPQTQTPTQTKPKHSLSDTDVFDMETQYWKSVLKTDTDTAKRIVHLKAME